MVNITVFRDRHEKWAGFSSKGHAGGAGNSQYDLVCAAISMHLQTIEYSLEKKIKLLKKEKKDGFLELLFDTKDSAKVEGIEEVFFNGLEILEGNFRKQVKVHNKEVETHV